MRLLSRFGDFSFSLYLIHLPIFVLLSSLLFRSSLQMSIWPSFGYMLVAVPVAYVFYRLVELPAMKWSASFKPKTRAKGLRRRSTSRYKNGAKVRGLSLRCANDKDGRVPA